MPKTLITLSSSFLNSFIMEVELPVLQAMRICKSRPANSCSWREAALASQHRSSIDLSRCCFFHLIPHRFQIQPQKPHPPPSQKKKLSAGRGAPFPPIRERSPSYSAGLWRDSDSTWDTNDLLDKGRSLWCSRDQFDWCLICQAHKKEISWLRCHQLSGWREQARHSPLQWEEHFQRPVGSSSYWFSRPLEFFLVGLGFGC